MTKKLFANGNNGVVSISEEDADINNPLNNINKIYFHSALDYLFIVQVFNGTINLPQRTADGSDVSSAYGSTIYNLGNHNLDYKPLLFGYVTANEQPVAGDTFAFAGGNASLRTVTLGADENTVYAREIFLNKDVTAPAQTVSYRLFIMGNPGL
jgi:hypothetical protein